MQDLIAVIAIPIINSKRNEWETFDIITVIVASISMLLAVPALAQIRSKS